MQVNTGTMKNALASNSQADVKKRSKEAPEPQSLMNSSSNRPTSGLIPSRVRLEMLTSLSKAAKNDDEDMPGQIDREEEKELRIPAMNAPQLKN